MTLVQLRYLVAVIDSGLNISHAAQYANTSQPGISNQLKLLEDELGFQIFLRKGKSLDCISEAGIKVVEHARAMLAEAAHIRTVAVNQRGEATGQIRIAATPNQARFALPAALSELKLRYLGVTAQIRTVDDRDAVSLLGRNEADVAIVNGSNRPPGKGVGLPLYQWALTAIAPMGHPLLHNQRALMTELAEYPLITDEFIWSVDRALTNAFAAADLRPNVACTVNDAATLKTYVRAGLGVGLLAEMDTHRDMDGLATLAIGGMTGAYTTWGLARPSRITPTYIIDFLCALAPHIDRRDIERSLELGQDGEFRAPPHWRAPGAPAESVLFRNDAIVASGRPMGLGLRPLDAMRLKQSA